MPQGGRRRPQSPRYELYYWSMIQGRGEFVRLALEEAAADYSDVARQPGGDEAMMKLMAEKGLQHAPFAPPFLKAGRLLIGQTANILMFLGDRHGLAPRSETGRLWAHQLQLTIADFLNEVHDTHHPIGSGLYYEDQKEEAARRSKDFLKTRAPKYLGYFERVLERNAEGKGFLIGNRASYPDLSLFQMVEGLRYAFPRSMRKLERKVPRVIALHDRVAEQPRIAAYLSSERRIPFNEQGIFRHYPDLDSAS
jgi:glutathione S-transferase